MTTDNTDDIYGVGGKKPERKSKPPRNRSSSRRQDLPERAGQRQLRLRAMPVMHRRFALPVLGLTTPTPLKTYSPLHWRRRLVLAASIRSRSGKPRKRWGSLYAHLDATIALKAADLFVKLQQAEKDRGEAPEDDGFSEWRFCRDLLCSRENGASVFMLVYKSAWDGMGHPANYPLLHDVWNLAQQEPFGKQIWDWCCQNLSPQMRECLQERLGDPKWQLEARIQIWKEIGVDITKMTRAA